MKDRVAAVQIQRDWAVPGLLDGQLAALDLGASILGGLASSRLDNALVRDEKMAVSVTAGLQPTSASGCSRSPRRSSRASTRPRSRNGSTRSWPSSSPRARPRTKCSAPRPAKSPAESARSSRSAVSAARRSRWPKGSCSPAIRFLQASLNQYAWVTPANVRSAMQQWLTLPAFTVRLEPGERPPYVEAKGAAAAARISSRRASSGRSRRSAARFAARLPDGPARPAVERRQGRLRPAHGGSGDPVALSFDAGMPPTRPASARLAEHDPEPARRGRRRADVAADRRGAGAARRSDRHRPSADRSTVEVVGAERQPRAVARPDGDDRPAADVRPGRDRARPDPDPDRHRPVAEGPQRRSPRGSCRCCCTARATPTRPPRSAMEGAVKSFTRDDIVGFQQRWLRPDNLEIFVVSNLPLAQVKPLLERRFGAGPRRPRAKGVKRFIAAAGAADCAAHRAGRPARFAAIDHPRRPGDADRPAQRDRRRAGRPTTSLAAISCRGSTWTCAKPRAGLWRARQREADRGGVRTIERAGPGRPHRRIDRRR